VFAAFLRRQLRRGLGLTIAAVAAIWSFFTLTNLAAYLGFGSLSWMFPLCIDALAALGMDYWMTRAPAWKAGRALALSAIAVSLVANPVDWLLREASPLAAAFGIIPPAALAAVLGIMHSNAAKSAALVSWLAAERDWREDQDRQRERDREARQSRQQDRQARRVTEPQTVTKLSPAPEPRQLPASDRERLAKLQRIAERTGRPPTKREAMEILGVGSNKALNLTRTVRETVTTETITTEDQEASA
jgi:hypothetical protein